MIFSKPFKATESDIIRDSLVYNIPMDIVEIIYSQNKTYQHWAYGTYLDSYSYDEYQNMLKGVHIAYHNQELLGRIIPNNSPQAIELHRYLGSKNIAIQYHPKHGMVLCDLDKNNM